MPGYVTPALRLEPAPGRMRVGHGLNGGESLGCNQEQRALRLQILEHAREFIAINIGDKVKALARGGKFSQRQHRHLRPQVRAANADVDDIGDGRVTAHLLRIGQHGVQRGMNLRQLGAQVRYVIYSCLRPSFLRQRRISQ